MEDSGHNDASLLDAVTEAVQAQERLQLQLRTRVNQASYKKVYPVVCSIMDSLREVKSEIDGSSVQFEHVTVNSKMLQEIKTHILMHVPGSMTPDVKSKLKKLVVKAFNGSCKAVLYVALVSCSWYRDTQIDRGLQAKHNTVFVVYSSKDRQLFTPINPHQKEKDSEIIDEGWFYATEVSHFASYLLKGKVRFIEVLHMPESAEIYTTEAWKSLKLHLEPNNSLLLKGFLEQCRGQAVGTIAKKSKSTGKMRLKDGATLYEFCEAFRLLHHASVSLTGGQLLLERIDETTVNKDVQQQALKMLKQSYLVDQCDKIALLDIVMKWSTEVDRMMKSCTYTPVNAIENSIGRWLLQIRTDGRELPKQQAMDTSQRNHVQSLLDSTLGGPMAAMVPDNILLIARAGSYLYGLDTVDSDVDYIVIYADPLQKVLSSCRRQKESSEDRGPHKSVEYGTYEARLFCEMLWKCSVVMLELIFAENLTYISPLWRDLVSNKHVFLTEKAILQYFGLIKNNMVIIESKQYINTKREPKLFYQILHKLYCLEYFVAGECPKIECDGSTKKYILRIRKGPLEGDISRERLYNECISKIHSLREHLSQRTRRLPENVNYNYLTDWLMKVRGWNVDI